MDSRPLKLFLFDLDGTLVSTGGAGLRALNATFHDLYGIPNILSQVHPSGKTDPAIFREAVQTFLHRPLNAGELETISEAYLTRLTEETKKTHLYRVLPGVPFLLDHLKTMSDVAVGLGTGNLERGAQIKLKPTGLNSYFRFGGFGSDAEERSTLLAVGHRRAEELYGESIASDDVYVIGDTELDVRAARRAGYRAVAVATGARGRDELAEAHPDFLLSDLSEGLHLVNEIRQQAGAAR